MNTITWEFLSEIGFSAEPNNTMFHWPSSPDVKVEIVGKGAEDFQEWVKPGRDGGTVRGWFDDRVEARHALVQATELWSVTSLDRSELPWMEWDEREARL